MSWKSPDQYIYCYYINYGIKNTHNTKAHDLPKGSNPPAFG